jgi:hypothetical protein
MAFRVRSLDRNGRVVSDAVPDVTWKGLPERWSAMSHDGILAVGPENPPAVAVIGAAAAKLTGTARVRVVPVPPYADDFEDAVLKPHPREQGVMFAPPRPYWIGANLKWEIRELDGNKVLARTIDRPLFQRTMSLIGHPDMSGYTVQVDVRTDGNRRSMSSPGVVNQRYLIVLKGNHQTLEVSSNMELLKQSVPFRWKAKSWYRLKTRVDVEADGSGWIRAKAWLREGSEPEDWTIEVRHPHAHTHGSPGLYGFTPQSRFRVYIDNLSVTPND